MSDRQTATSRDPPTSRPPYQLVSDSNLLQFANLHIQMRTMRENAGGFNIQHYYLPDQALTQDSNFLSTTLHMNIRESAPIFDLQTYLSDVYPNSDTDFSSMMPHTEGHESSFIYDDSDTYLPSQMGIPDTNFFSAVPYAETAETASTFNEPDACLPGIVYYPNDGCLPAMSPTQTLGTTSQPLLSFLTPPSSFAAPGSASAAISSETPLETNPTLELGNDFRCTVPCCSYSCPRVKDPAKSLYSHIYHKARNGDIPHKQSLEHWRNCPPPRRQKLEGVRRTTNKALMRMRRMEMDSNLVMEEEGENVEKEKEENVEKEKEENVEEENVEKEKGENVDEETKGFADMFRLLQGFQEAGGNEKPKGQVGVGDTDLVWQFDSPGLDAQV